MPNDYAVKSKGIIKTSSTGIYPSIEALFGPWNSFEEFRTYLGSIILKTVTDSDIPNGLKIGIKQSDTTVKEYKWTNPSNAEASWVLCNAVESVNNKTGQVSLTKSDFGLSNVDNTSDASKNVNSAVKDGSGNNIVSTYETKTDAQAKINALTKNSVGLGNVDNTADANKVVKGANEDGSGNVISTTYETKTDATTKQTGLQTAIAAIQSVVENLVGLEGTNYAGFSVDTTEADALAAIPTKYTAAGYTDELVWYLVGDGIDNLKAYHYDGTNTPVLISSKVYDFTDFSGIAADVSTLRQDLDSLGLKIEQVEGVLNGTPSSLEFTETTGKYYDANAQGVYTIDNSSSVYAEIDLSAYAGKTLTINLQNAYASSSRGIFLVANGSVVQIVSEKNVGDGVSWEIPQNATLYESHTQNATISLELSADEGLVAKVNGMEASIQTNANSINATRQLVGQNASNIGKIATTASSVASNTWITAADNLTIKSGSKFKVSVSSDVTWSRIIIGYNNQGSSTSYRLLSTNASISSIEREFVAPANITSIEVYCTLPSAANLTCILSCNADYDIASLNGAKGYIYDSIKNKKAIALNTAKINAMNVTEIETSTPLSLTWENGFWVENGYLDSVSSSSYLHCKVEIPSRTKRLELTNLYVFATGLIEVIFFSGDLYLSAITLSSATSVDSLTITDIPDYATHFGFNCRSTQSPTATAVISDFQYNSDDVGAILDEGLSEIDFGTAMTKTYISRYMYCNNCRLTSYSSATQITSGSGSAYSVTGFEVEGGETYHVQVAGNGADSYRFAALSSTRITSEGLFTMIEKYGDTTTSGHDILEITPSQSGYLLVEYDADAIPKVFKAGSTRNIVIADAVKAKNVLYGKKWAPIGDSFTYGSFSGALEGGKYEGKSIVYPYIIGNRNDMEILPKFFYSGRTLAYPSDGTFDNSICNPNADFYYQNIPADVDYITIYLGINDCQHTGSGSTSDGEEATGVITLGTIDDLTTATHYGAWNVMLTWLLENRPFAHIGIIVTNGSTQEYRAAQIAIANKFGLPYIDLNGDERTPFMIRSCNANIPTNIKNIRKAAQAVDIDGSITGSINTHPNDNAHLFESVFIENFLRSI